MPPAAVATLLANEEKRLIASGEDALEGVVQALESYGSGLQHESPSEVEDLWDTPAGEPPIPKHEERISDKVCLAL